MILDILPWIILSIAIFIAGYLLGFFTAAGMNEQDKGEDKDGSAMQELQETDDRMS